MHKSGRPAHTGEFSVVDLDGDGGSELILTWDSSLVPEKTERMTEIWAIDGPGRLRKVWSGPWEIDTMRDPDTAEGEQKHVVRAIDYGKTRALAGGGIVFTKTIHAVAGERLAEPTVTTQSVSLRLRP
jgi:hypothetical protein